MQYFQNSQKLCYYCLLVLINSIKIVLNWSQFEKNWDKSCEIFDKWFFGSVGTNHNQIKTEWFLKFRTEPNNLELSQLLFERSFINKYCYCVLLENDGKNNYLQIKCYFSLEKTFVHILYNIPFCPNGSCWGHAFYSFLISLSVFWAECFVYSIEMTTVCNIE
jgi:hypothetical protein